MFKHILVPLDGSELSEKALPVALQGLDLEVTLTLVNVIDLPDMNLVLLYDMPPVIAAHDNTEALLPEAQKSALEYLRGVVERVQISSYWLFQDKCLWFKQSHLTLVRSHLGRYG